MGNALINQSPVVYERRERRTRAKSEYVDEYAVEAIDQLEIYENITDPEHPYSLEELRVVTEGDIEVDDERSHVRVMFTPTMQHCGLAEIIGLCLWAKLNRSLPSRYKVDIRVAPGTHATEDEVNKLLNDKERVAAAMEKRDFLDLIEECIDPSYE